MVKDKNQTNKSSNKNIINIKIGDTHKKKKKRNNKKKSYQPQSGTYRNNVVQSSAPALNMSHNIYIHNHQHHNLHQYT
jgi:hypothetical protein